LSLGDGALALDGLARDNMGSVFHDLLDGFFIVEGDKSKSTRAVGSVIHHDDGILDMTEVLEVGTEVVGISFRGQTTDEDLFGSSDGAGGSTTSDRATGTSSAGRHGCSGNCKLRVDSLAVQGKVGGAEDLLGRHGVSESNESETSGGTGHSISHNNGIDNFTET